MTLQTDQEIKNAYLKLLAGKEFTCVAAREAVSRNQVECYIASHMGCPNDDHSILNFLYDFVEKYRIEKDIFHSAAIIFRLPSMPDEQVFDALMWKRLQALTDLDAKNYGNDQRVSPDPDSEKFSFSLKEEAFFILGLHPQSSRMSRRFEFPVLVFNPHDQFEKMRESGQYDKMKKIVRKREMIFSGSINPMLDDFGKSSEVYQYSGINYNKEWTCPLKNNHGNGTNHSTPKWGSISSEERTAS